MGFFEELEALGVDVEEGLDRVMGDADLYKMMLGIFVDTVHEDPLRMADFSGENGFEQLEHQVHTLKGTAGNLSISRLFEGYTEALGHLRNGKHAEAKAVLEKLLPEQEKIIACIERHRDEC